jgi:hypothetical protein
MIERLHNDESGNFVLDSKEGEQVSLCSNNRFSGFPSLGFNSDEESSEDILLETLAELLVDIHFELRYDQQKGSNLL